MSKILGISLGIGTDAFNLMRAYGIEADYIPSDTVREIVGFPTVYEKFAVKERKVVKNGSVKEYFSKVQKYPKFWDRYVNDTIFLAKPVREDEKVCGSKSGPVDFDIYDTVAVTAIDDYYKPLESLLSYLKGVCKKPVVVGGQIVRDETVPLLEKIGVTLNNGSFMKFDEMLNNQEPLGRVIKDKSPLRIESADILEKAKYAAVGTFDRKIREKNAVTYITGKNCAHFKVLGMVGCGNGCDYCSCENSLSISKDAWIDAINRLSKKEDSAALEIWDDNCFKHPKVYRDIFSQVYDKFEKVRINTYLDTENLFSVDGSEILLESVVDSPKTEGVALFFGRECADEAAAKVIGRRFNGVLRSQDMLDREKEKMKEVIRTLEGKDYRYATIVSYVLGPGGSDALENIKKDALEIKKGMDREKVKIQIQPLNAYPGTDCHERFKGDLMSAFPGVSISNIYSENMIEFEKAEPRVL